MDEVLAALAAQQAECAAVIAGRDDQQLLAPSRCPGWTVADVLVHLAQTNEMAAASAAGELDAWIAAQASGLGDADAGGSIDDWAGQLVAAQRTTPTAARARWAASVGAQAEALAACDPSARLRWVAGELAARTLATTRLTEAWIHTVDLAVAYGPPPAPTDRLRHTARLAWRTLPYAFARAGEPAPGPVGFDLNAPDGSRWPFGMADDPPTVVHGPAVDLCTVAGQRAAAADTALRADGPDAAAVLRLVRTFA